MAVIVLDKHHKPLMPCSEGRARCLLEKGRARVHKLHPFTIRLVDRLLQDSIVDESVLSTAPGSRETGTAVTGTDGDTTGASSGRRRKHKSDWVRRQMEERAKHRRYRRSKYQHHGPSRTDRRHAAEEAAQHTSENIH